MRVVVVGGGIAGAAAALQLAEGGAQVTVLEAGQRLGGLVVSFEVGGTPLECFYHHIFPGEAHIRGLIDRLGLTDKLVWLPSTMGVLRGGRIWPFTGALDLLRFGPLTLPQRVRLGLGALRLMRSRDWRPLDDVPARDWLAKATGPASVEALWGPLLAAKFGPAAATVPAAWMWGRFEQRAAARKRGGETLGYLRGGFRQLFDGLSGELVAAGVDLRLGTRAAGIEVTDGRVTGVRIGDDVLSADAVLYTGNLPGLSSLIPEPHRDPGWQLPGLGVLCVVIEMDRPATDVYWTNVCDPALPFGGIIEHTNLLAPADYGGRHVMYLSRYFTADEDVAAADSAAEADRWLAALDGQLDGFDRSSVLAVHPFRTPYAAPLVDLGYAAKVPSMRSTVDGLFICTTAQIYPHDRGMNEGLVMAERVVGVMRG